MDEPDVQEDLSMAEVSESTEEAVQDGPSTAEGESREPTAAELQQQIAALTKEAEDAKRLASAHQAAKDREVGQARRELTELHARLEAGRNQAEINRLRQLRDSDDPEDRDRYIAEIRAAEQSETTRSEALQVAAQRAYNDIMLDDEIPQDVRYEAQDRAMRDAKGLSAATLARHIRIVTTERASQPLSEYEGKLKTLQDELEALKGAQAGSNIRNAGGPERPASGVADSRSDEEILLDPRTPIETLKAILAK